jgi:hypothetical protein
MIWKKRKKAEVTIEEFTEHAQAVRLLFRLEAEEAVIRMVKNGEGYGEVTVRSKKIP